MWSVGFSTVEWAVAEEMGWIYSLVVLGWLLVLHRGALPYIAVTRNAQNPYHRFSVRFNLVVLACKQSVPILTCLSRVTGGWIGGGLLLGLYVLMFAFLLVVNIYAQPCRGSGRFANNFRSSSFGSSFWLSGWYLVSYSQDHIGSDTTIFSIGLGTALLVFAVVWRVNDRRAIHTSVPEKPISDLFDSSSVHVCAVAYRLIDFPRDGVPMPNVQQVVLYAIISDKCTAIEVGLDEPWERCEILVACVNLLQQDDIKEHLGRSVAEKVSGSREYGHRVRNSRARVCILHLDCCRDCNDAGAEGSRTSFVIRNT
jgi:hypothetical protein